MNTKTQTCGKAVARKKSKPILLEQKQIALCEKPVPKRETEDNQEGTYWWQRGQYA